MYLKYMDSFRGLAILSIVLPHCIFASFYTWSLDSVSFPLLKTLGAGSTSLFVFISGFLFQYLIQKYHYLKYLKTKFFYIILPYLIVSIPAIFRAIYLNAEPTFQAHNIGAQVALYYLTGMQLTAFWFMPTIILFYFISPVLYQIDKYHKLYWLLPIAILLSIWIPRDLSEIHNPLRSFVHYFAFYLFGMFVSHYHEQVLQWIKRYLYSLLTVFILLFSFEYAWRYLGLIHHGNGSDYTEMINTVRLFPEILLLVYVMKKQEVQLYPRLHLLASMSFGIYFVHSYVLLVSNALLPKLGVQLEANLVLFLLHYGLIIGLSMCVLGLIKRLFRTKSRFLVGY